MQQQTNSPIITEYRARTRTSEQLAEQARQLFPSGITHDARYASPYGIYVEKALGPRKWDADGNEYVDYFGGHGALLLGHNHPEVEEAVVEAVRQGTHFGANHRTELAWAEKVCEMVPSAERVRFTSSGTEATHMALRLARAFTGRSKLLRFRTHFHGWHDHMAFGVADHFDGSPGPGVLKTLSDEVVLADPGDVNAVADHLDGDDTISAVIVEPVGGSSGITPLAPGFLTALRDLTHRHGVLLIFDEVVTGFRIAPGGAQAYYGVTPDISSLAKILSGGLPGGAVVGSAEILDHLDFEAARAGGFEKIPHPGTFNANPVSAAAGLTALTIIDGGDACERANAFGEAVRAGMNEVLVRQGIAYAVYGVHSMFHIFMNEQRRKIDPHSFDPREIDFMELKARALANKLRLAMLIHGVDVNGTCTGLASATHGDVELQHTVNAFEAAIAMLAAEEDLPRL